MIPVLALEGLGPRAAIDRSSHLVRERWGEGVTGAFAIGGIAFLFGILPAIALIVIGIAVAGSAPALAAVLIVIGGLILVVAVLLQTTISAVFRVALLRYATDRTVLAGYDETELAGAFAPRRRGLR